MVSGSGVIQSAVESGRHDVTAGMDQGEASSDLAPVSSWSSGAAGWEVELSAELDSLLFLTARAV